VLHAFQSFLERNVKQYDYQHHKVHFAGSVAYYYQAILEEAIHQCGMELGNIMQAPMAGLIDFRTVRPI
jgi:hypothetical protein